MEAVSSPSRKPLVNPHRSSTPGYPVKKQKRMKYNICMNCRLSVLSSILMLSIKIDSFITFMFFFGYTEYPDRQGDIPLMRKLRSWKKSPITRNHECWWIQRWKMCLRLRKTLHVSIISSPKYNIKIFNSDHVVLSLCTRVQSLKR